MKANAKNDVNDTHHEETIYYKLMPVKLPVYGGAHEGKIKDSRENISSNFKNVDKKSIRLESTDYFNRSIIFFGASLLLLSFTQILSPLVTSLGKTFGLEISLSKSVIYLILIPLITVTVVLLLINFYKFIKSR